MKVKVGDMDIEGTPEECKAFLKNLEDATIHSAPNSQLPEDLEDRGKGRKTSIIKDEGSVTLSNPRDNSPADTFHKNCEQGDRNGE